HEPVRIRAEQRAVVDDLLAREPAAPRRRTAGAIDRGAAQTRRDREELATPEDERRRAAAEEAGAGRCRVVDGRAATAADQRSEGLLVVADEHEVAGAARHDLDDRHPVAERRRRAAVA